MSWLSPKHLDDASRILRGVALILAKAAIDSTTQRAALRQAQAAALAAANAAATHSQQLQQQRFASPSAASQTTAGFSPLVTYLYPHTVALLTGTSQPQRHQQDVQQQSWQRLERAQQAQQLQQEQQQAAYDSTHQSLQHLQQEAGWHAGPAVQQEHRAAAAGAAPSPAGSVAATATPHQATAREPLQPQQAAAAADAAPLSHELHVAAPVSALEQHQPAAAAAAAAAAAGQSPSDHVDSWMSGHESVTTEAEAVLPAPAAEQQQPQQQKLKVLRERRVPSTQIGRALGFAGMGASLLFGSITDSVSRTLGGSGSSSGEGGSGSSSVYSNFITESNAERLANALCRMRGAALKIGQMLSIQDETVLPPQIQSALERVRAGADVMPRTQLEGQLVAELGQDWLAKLSSFDWTPRAAASIGQVHAAQLHDGTQVAMKIQYPGVARSIESDVDNLMRLIRIANILPKGLYVESAVKVAKRELALECNYSYEAAAQGRFRELVAGDPQLAQLFYVPQVYPELCSRQILTTEWVNGITIDKVAELSQEVRDHVGTCLLRLTLRELYDWRFMQTDPNWGNFLYDQQSGVLNLIDFGAAKQYPRSFVDRYLRMVHACAERDRRGVVNMSVALGFLTGDESSVMLDAHTEAGFVVGLPFATPGIYDFGSHSGMTPRVAELGSIMLKHRLTPPPEESYSLHRKLSGAFLACMKLRARVPCRDLFFHTFDNYRFEGAEDAAGGTSDDADVPHTATA